MTSDLGNDLSKATMKKFCASCFRTMSTIAHGGDGDNNGGSGFDRSYETVDSRGSGKGDGTTSTSSDVLFIFVHGGGGCRAMFRPHAEALRDRYGHGSILLDLPGHGTLEDRPLTVESCCEQVKTVLGQCGLLKSQSSEKKKKIVYVGGSLGAYAGFYVLDKLKDDVSFQGAILIDCGQNVGPGASLKARLGLVFLEWLGRLCSNATMMKMLVDVTKKSKADYKLIETFYGAGSFFGQADAQVACLRAVAPARHIPSLDYPILYMNGGDDYRDSEVKWLDLCTHKSKSDLKVYDGGDHFFTHDTRFVDDVLEQMDAFAKKL